MDVDMTMLWWPMYPSDRDSVALTSLDPSPVQAALKLYFIQMATKSKQDSVHYGLLLVSSIQCILHLILDF